MTKKLVLGYPTVKTDDPTVISFESIPVCDRQTHGQTDGHAVYS